MRGQQTRWSWSIRSVVAILTTMILLSGLTMTAAPVSAASGPTVYWGVKSGPIDLPASKFAAVATLPLPRGRYLVTATATFEGWGGLPGTTLDTRCRLVLGSVKDHISATPAPVSEAGSRVPILLTVAGRLGSPGAARLRCSGGSSAKGDVRIRDIRMQAIRLGKVTLRNTSGMNVTYGSGAPRVISTRSGPTTWSWVPGDGAYHGVATLALPRGRWWVITKAVATSAGSSAGAHYRCRLDAGHDYDDVRFGFSTLSGATPSMPLALNTLHPFDSPGQARLRCKGSSGFFVSDIAITAIKAGRIVNIPLDGGAVGWSAGSGSPLIRAGYANGTSPYAAWVPARLTYKTIRKLYLPRGHWTVFSKLWFEGNQGSSGIQTADCRLAYGKRRSPSHLHWVTGSFDVAPMVLSIDHQAKSAGAVKLQCRRWGPGGTARAYFIKITALKVGTLIKRPL